MEYHTHFTIYCFALLFLIIGNNLTCLVIIRQGIAFNPHSYLIGVFTLQVLGTLPVLDLNSDSDFWHSVILVIVSYIILMYVVFIYPRRRRLRKFQIWQQYHDDALSQEELFRIIVLLILSTLLSILYYQIVGYNLFLLAMNGDVSDFTSMRLAAYAGEEPTGAGVFNQFKNTIIPICFAALLYHILDKRKPLLTSLYLCIMIPLLLYCLMGAGQRAYVFFLLIMFLIVLLNGDRKNYTLVAALIVGFLAVFGVYSALLGRLSVDDSGSLSAATSQLYYRIFVAQQIGSVNGFRYIYEFDYTFGYEWLECFIGLVPGIKGSDLSHRVHAYMFGSIRGTVPVSFWVSAYHNFGLFGVASATLSLLLFLSAVHGFILELRKTSVNRFASAALILYCALIAISHPAQIFNNGLFGLILLFLVVGTSRFGCYIRGRPPVAKKFSCTTMPPTFQFDS